MHCERWLLRSVQHSRRVFAECCSLGRVGVSHETDDSNVLAPGAQLDKYAFESCLTLTTITFDVDKTNKPRALPEGAFCGAGIEQLCLPSDFHNIGPRACENCKRLVEVNLMGTEITALLSATFAHCVALNCVWLPPRLTQIGKEVFLNCVVLQEVVIPTELSDIGNRAFCGCEQLQRFTPLDWGDIEQWCRQSTMLSLCVTNLKNPSGWSCSLQMDPIRTLLTRNYTTSTPDVVPDHNRLKVGALASVFRKYLWLSEQPMSSLRHFWLKQ